MSTEEVEEVEDVTGPAVAICMPWAKVRRHGRTLAMASDRRRTMRR